MIRNTRAWLGLAAIACSASAAPVHAQSWWADVADPTNHPQIRYLQDWKARGAPKGVAAPGISLSVRVTLTPGGAACLTATETSLAVTPGTTVNFCYTVENTGDVALGFHDIDESRHGLVRAGYVAPLAPGQVIVYSHSRVVTQGGMSEARWFAHDAAPTYEVITGTCSFPNIAPTGIALSPSDDGVVPITFPQPFAIYGIPRLQAQVCNNGKIDFEPNPCSVTNTATPTGAHPLSVMPYWDDLDTETGNVYFGPFNYNRAPSKGVTSYSVVQWQNRPHFPGPGASGATFAIGMIGPGQGIDGYMFACYPDTDFDNAALDLGASATLAVNRDAELSTQFSFNTIRPELTGNFGVGYLPTLPAQNATATATTTILFPAGIFQDGFE